MNDSEYIKGRHFGCDCGDPRHALEINRTRFGMSDQLAAVFRNTVREMGWEE